MSIYFNIQGMSDSRPTFVFNGINFHSPNNGGWHLPAGSENSVSVPFDFMAGRLEFEYFGCLVQSNDQFLGFGPELSARVQWIKTIIVRQETVVLG